MSVAACRADLLADNVRPTGRPCGALIAQTL